MAGPSLFLSLQLGDLPLQRVDLRLLAVNHALIAPLLLLQHGRFLAVEIFEDAESRLQQPLGLALVRHRHFVLLVLLLAVLARFLHLRLHLCDLGLECVDLLFELLDGRLQSLDLVDQVLLLAFFPRSLHLVLVELFHAEGLQLDLLLFLFQEVHYHLVNCLLHLGESVQADLVSQLSEAWAVQFLGRGGQDLRHLVTAGRIRDALPLQQRRVEGPGEDIVRVVAAECRQRLGHRLDLQLTGLLALLPLVVCHLALLLQHHDELLVGAQSLFGVRDILLCLRVLLVRVSPQLLLGLELLLSSRNLLLLRSFQFLVGLLVRRLFLLRVGKVLLESVLHRREDAENLARLRSVR
mmetsp:Transcript_72270/g.233860  ORF Transcript_72270/g.233860 Transcript_72270/m.233860 type:complete len:352 (+) Transcript_72270:149-1204(+)